MNKDFFLGRQSVVSSSSDMFAFELLFRSSAESTVAKFGSGRIATSKVIQCAFTELGLENSLGTHKGFVNVDQEFLFDDLLELIPRHRVGVELTNDVLPFPKILSRLSDLKQDGFFFSLDDFTNMETTEAFLPFVDFIKVDASKMSVDEIGQVTKWCLQNGVSVCAKKVDSEDVVRALRERGVEMFQGFFFSKPEIIRGKRILPSETAILSLMDVLQKNSSVSEIEQVFKSNPELSFSLLRLVNSVVIGELTPIASLSDAVVSLGKQQLQRWLQLLLFSGGVSNERSLGMLIAMIRANMMELLSKEMGASQEECDKAYLVGLLSCIETVSDTSLQVLVSQIPLDGEIRSALSFQQGRIGKVLSACILLEKGNTNESSSISGVQEGVLVSLYSLAQKISC